jgi:hypothetical protein
VRPQARLAPQQASGLGGLRGGHAIPAVFVAGQRRALATVQNGEFCVTR